MQAITMPIFCLALGVPGISNICNFNSTYRSIHSWRWSRLGNIRAVCFPLIFFFSVYCFNNSSTSTGPSIECLHISIPIPHYDFTRTTTLHLTTSPPQKPFSLGRN
ncbi:hypothetical protein BGX38DRAFT_287703 [Terfezia claveryi]|nr:hypothetical protein BGX38DRAFT_287703 [Terfezia claveryi]